jgi:hypothetical protein
VQRAFGVAHVVSVEAAHVHDHGLLRVGEALGVRAADARDVVLLGLVAVRIAGGARGRERRRRRGRGAVRLVGGGLVCAAVSFAALHDASASSAGPSAPPTSRLNFFIAFFDPLL